MRYSNIFSSLIFASLSLSASVHQHHQHAKREAEPAFVTVFVTVTGPPSDSTTAPTGFSSFAVQVENAAATNIAPVASSGSTVPTTLQTSTRSSSSSAAWVEIESSSSSSSSAKSSSTAASGSVEAYASQARGITYSPYQNDGSCKSASDIASDISMLSDYDVIRVYAPDCSCVSNIMSNMGSSQKLFAGLYYMDSLSSDVSLLAQQVTASSQGWNGIYAVAIGNEWVNAGTYSASQVSAAVASGRSLLAAQGYTGDVVTVDTIPAYTSNTVLCDASDFIAVNSHPYWDGGVQAADSGPWLQTQISNIKSTCGGQKNVLVCETGWPTQGDTYGTYGIPSTANQLSAIKSIVEEVADQVIMFTTYNDFWKDAGSYGVEQYWGIYN